MKAKAPGRGKFKISLTIFIIGILALISGGTFMLINFLTPPHIRDAEYLVGSSFQLEDEPAVVWHFTEIGHGTLTTDSNANNYDFLWSIEGDKLKIETDWLYTLNNEYTYILDQSTGMLTLTEESSPDSAIVFTKLAAAEPESPETPEELEPADGSENQTE